MDVEIEHRREPRLLSVLKCLREIGCVSHGSAESAERTGVSGEVGVREVRSADSPRVEAFLVSPNRPVHSVVEDKHYHRQFVAHGCGQFLSAHQKVAVAGEGDHGCLRVQRFGAYCGREGVAHRPAGGAELGAVLAELIEALRPEAEVPRSVGEHGVGGEMLPQVLHHFPEVEFAWYVYPFQGLVVVAARLGAPVRPGKTRGSRRGCAGCFWGGCAGCFGGGCTESLVRGRCKKSPGRGEGVDEFRGVGADGQGRFVDAA